MKGVDYTKALARERDNFQNTIQKDREHTSRRISDEEKRHAELQKKQTEVFLRDKSKLEKDYEANLESIQEKTSNLMDVEKESFHKINRDQLENFTKQRETLRKDFDQKMSNITDSYHKARQNDKEFNQSINNEKDARYQKNFDRLTKDRDVKIAEYAKKFEGSGEHHRDQMNIEKGHLTRAHQDQLKTIYQEEAGKRYLLKEGLQEDLARTKAANRSENEMSQKYVKSKIDRLTNNFNNNIDDMRREYSQKNEELVKKQKEKDYKTNKEHQSEVAKLRSDNERKLRMIDIEKRRRDNGQGEFSKVVQRQQGKSAEDVYLDRINKLKENLDDARKLYDERTNSDRESYRDSIISESVDSLSRQEKTEKLLTADKIVEVAREKDKSARILEKQIMGQRAERIQHEEHMMQERNQASFNVTQLKENFNKSLRDLEEKNEKFMIELKELSNNEKSKFIINANKERNEEIFELRKNFGKLMDSTTNNYETKIRYLEGEIHKLKQDLDGKISMILNDADNKISLQAEYYNEKRIADQKSYHAALDAKNVDFRNKTLELSDSFQRKMNAYNQLNVTKNKEIVNNYEAKLKIKDAEAAKTLNEMQAIHAAEIQSLKSTLAQEKAQLTAQFSNKIDQMEIAHKEQIDKLNEYNRLS